MDWHIGTIGYSYRDWRGAFYPANIPVRSYLNYYSRVFNSVELDTTFYGIPRLSVIHQWSAAVPEGFYFCLKTPKAITHELGLLDAGSLMEEFINTVRELGNSLGVILIQLPPSFTFERIEVLANFLSGLTRDVRYAVELRSKTWYEQEALTAALLTENNICWTAIDMPGIPSKIIPTCRFLYIRWIGQHGAYHPHSHERILRTAEQEEWLAQIVSVQNEVDQLFGFFNNDYCGFAAGTARRFKSLAGLPDDVDNTEAQMRLF